MFSNVIAARLTQIEEVAHFETGDVEL